MLCQNCGKNEVNFKYTQIINGVKKQMALCDKCAKELGIESLDFNMPINFSSFFGDFLGEMEEASFLPTFAKTKTLQCDYCNMTYEEFVSSGKFGCKHCYDVFSNGLDKVLKNIHGSNSHTGRNSSRMQELSQTKAPNITKKTTNHEIVQNEKKNNTKEEKVKQLNIELKQAIKEERYEDAAKLRDEIKKMSL